MPGLFTPAINTRPDHVRTGVRLHPQLPWMVLPPGVPSQLALGPLLAPLPKPRPWLPGVLNLRGKLVPVFDIGRWHGLDALGKGAQVLVIAPGRAAVAVLCCGMPSLLEVRDGVPVTSTDPMAALASTWFQGPQSAAYEFNPQTWMRRIGPEVPGSPYMMRGPRANHFFPATLEIA